MKKCLKDAEEILQKQRKAEEKFLKILRKFDPEKPEESFKKLWVSERCYINHIEDRLDEKVVSSWKDYLEKTLETLAFYTNVYYEKYSKSWDRIFYDKKRQWMVVITEKGRIISSMKVKKTLIELFNGHKLKAEQSQQTLDIYKGEPNEDLKKEAKRILKTLRSKK